MGVIKAFKAVHVNNIQNIKQYYNNNAFIIKLKLETKLKILLFNA